MVPAGTLLDELLNGMWRLLACDILVVINYAHAGMRETQADTKISIFSQAKLVPAAQLIHQFAPYKDGIATEWSHTDARKEVHG